MSGTLNHIEFCIEANGLPIPDIGVFICISSDVENIVLHLPA